MRLPLLCLVLLATIVAGCATPAPVELQEAPARDLLARGQALIVRGEMAAATVPLRAALRLQPSLADARESLALALSGMGDLDGALEELRTVRRQLPDATRARLALATVLMAKQDWSSARAELEEVIRRQPDLTQAHYSLGVVLYSMQDLNGAIEAYRHGLVSNPGHPDLRYNLALLLTVAHRDAEATPEFLAAARAGHARAQYFLGTAYARGLGVEPDLALAIMWWSRAADQGAIEATAALRDLRRAILDRSRRGPAERQTADQAFRDYRATLWKEFPELARSGDDDTVGAALLRQGRGREAVPVLIWEAWAFSERAQTLLETLYYHGVKGQLLAHDARILHYFRTAAEEGEPRPRIALARFYAGGLGVPQDMARAISLLKATPHEDAQRLLQELSAASEAGPAPARP